MGDKTTPLHIAARYGVVDVINLLLDDDRVSPNVVNVNQQTPLHFAAMHNQPRAVAVLIKRYTIHRNFWALNAWGWGVFH